MTRTGDRTRRQQDEGIGDGVANTLEMLAGIPGEL